MTRRPWLLAASFLLCLPALASGQGAPDGASAGPDAASLERHLDGMVRYAMEEHHLPGVVVSVVHGDSLLLARGWGRARLRPDAPVDPRRTLFRVGSISKTFTFTGVMQQVESGRLRLDEDVATYLEDVEIRGSDRYGPISMTHLMTHTAGFEATPLDGNATSLEEDRSPSTHVGKYQPARVRPPGELASYSNFGVDLAGKVLQDVSGVEFAAYMDRNVLEPLGMHRSSFRDDPGEPADGYLRPDLADDRAIGYYWSGGRFRSYGGLFLHRGAYPSASLSATAVDIARFMRAHLNGGAVAGSRVLAPETTERMHRVAFRNADGLMGNAHGFWSRRLVGFRTLEHGGSVLGFRSNLVLVPELDLGIFVSTNGADGGGLVTRVPRMVLEHAFGGRSARPGPDAPLTDRAAAYSGAYLGTRRAYTTLGKLYAMMASTATVSVTESGDLLVTGLGEPGRYGRVGGTCSPRSREIDRSPSRSMTDGRAASSRRRRRTIGSVSGRRLGRSSWSCSSAPRCWEARWSGSGCVGAGSRIRPISSGGRAPRSV